MQTQNQTLKTIKDRETELMRELSQVEIISADTIVKLRIQDEQLNRMNKEMIVINDNLTLSEKIIKKMKSLFYFLGDKPTIESITSSSSSPVIVQTECIQTCPSNSSDILDNVLHRLNIIKSNAKTQNTLLIEQNKKLDNIINNTDDVITKIGKLNSDIRKI